MNRVARELNPAEIERYRTDGVIHARGVIAQYWLDRMAAAVDRLAASPSLFGRATSKLDDGYISDLFMWKTDDDFRDWVYQSQAAALASQVLGSKTVRHFYDQLFVKRPGCDIPTPWHHDITFWPLDSECRQITSIWIPLDPVDRQGSSLELVRGSHAWPERFKAVTPQSDERMLDPRLADPPDIDARRGDYDLFCPTVQPGDALIFNAHVVHGSRGNGSPTTTRRAFASRWMAPGIVYAPRRATMPLLWAHGLKPGDTLSGPLFPQVLPAPIAEEGATRDKGPEAPDATMIARVFSVGR